MRILFLDIDGVLNSRGSLAYWFYEQMAGRVANAHDRWCPILTNNYRHLLSELPADVKVVLSSTRRSGRDLTEIQQLFLDRDVCADRVIGKTPDSSSAIRGLEIQAWLDLHPEVTDFVILDDDSDMAHLLPHLIKTDFRDGLVMSIVDRVTDRFTPPNGGVRTAPKLPRSGVSIEITPAFEHQQ